MQSKIAETIHAKYPPMAIVLSDRKPEKARQFKEGTWGCVMFMVAAVLKGETAVFDRQTFGCFGGGTGLGFGDQYKSFPGGEKGFCYFLSVGNREWDGGEALGKQVEPHMRSEAFHHFMYGERYMESPENVEKWLDIIPITDIDNTYVIFKPLSEVQEDEKPEVIVFYGNMDQISALHILANYGCDHNENVVFPYAAGCQTIGIYPFAEAKKQNPRAVLGLSDVSARLYLKRILKDDVMSFAIPMALYREMEDNVEASFLKQGTWQSLLRLAQDK